ncbi:MAG: putative sugar O-methyltransferase [Comamonadaceae bacterium]|nr:putative sugar O-methyltransferase [Comamonadaceae bacterium]
MNQSDAALDVLLHDMDAADPLYRPTPFWRAALSPLVDELRGDNLRRFRSLPGPLSFFVPTYGFAGYHANPQNFAVLRDALGSMQLSDARSSMHLERLISGEAQAESDYRTLLASDTPGAVFIDRFSESRVADPIEQFEFEGRRFGRSSLNYLLGLSFLKRHCDLSTVRTVLEIGGGFGSLGEILLADPRNDIFYIDVDIAPTIACAHHYLAAIHGNAVVLDYMSTRNVAELDIAQMRATYRAATLVSWQLPKLQGKIDLFVNFISFQEMEPDVVKNYLSHVTRLGPRFVLLRNILEGKAKATAPGTVGVIDPIKGEMYDSYLDAYQLLARNTIPFGYRTVDGFHSELRLYERR